MTCAVTVFSVACSSVLYIRLSCGPVEAGCVFRLHPTLSKTRQTRNRRLEGSIVMRERSPMFVGFRNPPSFFDKAGAESSAEHGIQRSVLSIPEPETISPARPGHAVMLLP